MAAGDRSAVIATGQMHGKEQWRRGPADRLPGRTEFCAVVNLADALRRSQMAYGPSSSAAYGFVPLLRDESRKVARYGSVRHIPTTRRNVRGDARDALQG